MTGKLKLAAMILMGCAAVVASGQSLIGAENLLISPPKDFKVGFESTRDNRLMTEWVHLAAGRRIDDVMHALAKVTVCDARVPDHPCPRSSRRRI